MIIAFKNKLMAFVHVTMLLFYILMGYWIFTSVNSVVKSLHQIDSDLTDISVSLNKGVNQ